ncbi:MAG TPA: zinc ribbon domain-containing protein [Candidatus Dormibacteraeota bacterium]|nr:zinc ribbon domain-containing protein [Candidatus Dormibacteraeota bacterium]
MAMTCARCGAQNPDGNLYCQSCGTPLTAAPPAPMPGPPPGPPSGPPPSMAPPVFTGPAGYASPYYAPAGVTAPVHRTPWMLIIAAVVALVVLMAGCGTALAILGNRGSVSISGSVGTADLPSPTPAVTPSPVASSPTPASGPGIVANDTVSLTVPSGWTVVSKDSQEIVLEDPSPEGEVDVASGSSSPAASAQDNKAGIDKELTNKYPDTRACPNTKTINSTLNGVKGISWSLCFTLTDGTHSVPAAASLFVGANTSGSVYYLVIVLTRQDNLTSYLKVTAPVTASIHWKL